MPKRKLIQIEQEEAKDYWSNVSRINSQAQLSIIEPETKEKTGQKASSYQREIIAPEDALEQFVQSVCFAEYLFQAYSTDVILELHPYRQPSGWLWDCWFVFCPGLRDKSRLNLKLPIISDELYQRMRSEFYTKDSPLIGIYTLIGNAYKKDPALDVYAQRLRNDLNQLLLDYCNKDISDA
jgi:hypothetical protein